MPIEFRCPECSRLLRTQDETAGKKAKCPECGAIVTIPTPGPPPEAGMPPGVPSPGPGAGPQSPFGPIEPPPTGPASPFAPGAAPDMENPYASPADYTIGAPAGPAPAPGAFVPTRIDAGDVLSRAWTIYKDKWPVCVGAVLIVGILNWVAGQVPNQATMILRRGASDPAVTMAVAVVLFLAAQMFGLWMSIGQGLVFLNVARGREASLADIFRGGRYFLPILGASILFTLIYVGGLLLFIVPGIIFAIMFSQYFYLILDRNVGVFESLGLSREITRGNKVMIFLLWAISVALIFGGLLMCCVGVLATAPLVSVMWAVAYLAMTGQPTGDQQFGGSPAAWERA